MSLTYPWYKKGARPLPAAVAGLPCLEAELWREVCPGSELSVSLEGPIFDTAGNFYFCCNAVDPAIGEKVMKITPDGEMTEFFRRPGMRITGLAVHKDGRIFGADLRGHIVILQPDGTCERAIPIRTPEGAFMAPDDLVFDDRGNLYFTDLRGWPGDPTGGLYRMTAESDYAGFELVLGNLCGPNGISFTPDYKALWIGESGRKCLTRIELLPDGTPNFHGGFNVIPLSLGVGIPDSNKVDSDGNVYQAVVKSGRVAISDPNGIQLANVLIPGRDEGLHLMSSNLVIRPGTDECYCVAGGEPGNPVGAAIFRFRALAPAQELYSHM